MRPRRDAELGCSDEGRVGALLVRCFAFDSLDGLLLNELQQRKRGYTNSGCKKD